MKKINDKKKQLLSLICDRWVSVNELTEKLGCSTQQVYNLINNLVEFPIGEGKIDGRVCYKYMNKGDYE